MSLNYCEKCGSPMSHSRKNRQDGGQVTSYSCIGCGRTFEEGSRFNPLINEFVEFIRFF